MAPRISVIMPVCGGSSRIGQAVESVLLQQGPSWELLLVNDGSTNGASSAIARYATLDNRVRALENTRREGLGGSRNEGLEHAEGEYVVFLDSSDMLVPGALLALHNGILQNNVPVLRGAGIQFCRQRWAAEKMPGATRSIRSGGGLIPFPPRAFQHHIYQTSFLKKHNISFPEDIIAGEDVLFLCRVYARLDSLPTIRNPISIHTINSRKNLPSTTRAAAFITCNLRVRALFEQQDKDAWVVPYIDQVFFAGWRHPLHAMLQAGREQAEWFLSGTQRLMSGWEPHLLKTLKARIEPIADELCACSQRGDVPGMLSLVKQHGVGLAPPEYAGIDKPASKIKWLRYLLLRRMINPFRTALNAKTIWYLTMLRLRPLWRPYAAKIPSLPGGQGKNHAG